MRKRVKFEGAWYKPVPWLKHESCDGCSLYHPNKQCLNEVSEGEPCLNGEFKGKVFIRCGKEGLAEYIAKKLSL